MARGGGATNSCKFSHIITPGMHLLRSLLPAVCHDAASQQSGTSSTYQLENTTRTSPHYTYCADGNGLFHIIASVLANGIDLLTAGLRRCGSTKTLACCQAFSLLLPILRDWLGKMMAVAQVSSHAGRSAGETGFRLHRGDAESTPSTHGVTCANLALHVWRV